VVLAWALGRFDIPPHDRLVEVDPLGNSLGLLDSEAGKAILANSKLRSREEIGQLRKRLFALHWRLRNFRIRPNAIDFPEFARTCWFGPLDLSGVPLVGGDLALEGRRIDEASASLVATANSIGQERHQAVNWLWEGPARYADASVAT
jgi:predicted NUDIX family NTP pyrophosphohydrolase